jgi:hypothetical protein
VEIEEPKDAARGSWLLEAVVACIAFLATTASCRMLQIATTVLLKLESSEFS